MKGDIFGLEMPFLCFKIVVVGFFFFAILLKGAKKCLFGDTFDNIRNMFSSAERRMGQKHPYVGIFIILVGNQIKGNVIIITAEPRRR